MGSSIPGIVMPFRLMSFRIRHASGSMPRSKMPQDMGSPWRIPLVILKESLRTPLMVICVLAFQYRALIVLINSSGRLKAFSVAHK
jgi:hypothetical protein